MSKFTRRDFIKRSALAGAALTLPWKLRGDLPSLPFYSVNNSPFLTKWSHGLRGLGSGKGLNPEIPVLTSKKDPVFPNTLMYEIMVGEFQDSLHPQLGPTTLWGYWDKNNPVQRHLGGFFIGTRGVAARFRMTNVLPPEPTIPLDTTAFFFDAQTRKNAIATHLHGGFVPWLSDGGPFEWFTPKGSASTVGPSFSNGPGGIFDNISSMPMQPGQADYFYPNDQSFRLMWYHDHAHDQTRTNAYAGIATGFLLFDSINDAYVDSGKIPDLASTIPLIWQDKKFVWGDPNAPITDPASGTYGLDPTWFNIMKQGVQTTGSLWYRHIFDPGDLPTPLPSGLLPLVDPSCVPEYFGDTMLVNGTVFPHLTIYAKRYRFLLLNACNARVMNLNLLQADPANPDGINYDPAIPGIPTNPVGPAIIQIGAEGGFLPKEVVFTQKQLSSVDLTTGAPMGNLILAPAERADLIIDFTGCAGQEFIIYNDAPAPFPSGDPLNDYYVGNPTNPVNSNPNNPQPAGTGPDTRQVLRIKVVDAPTPEPQPKDSAGNFLPILDAGLMDPTPLVDVTPYAITTDPAVPVPPLAAPAGAPVRDITLNEGIDDWGRLTQTIGTLVPTTSNIGAGFGQALVDPPTEVLKSGTTEVWQVWNFTGDVHPIHFHLVNLQLLSRQTFATDATTGAPIFDTTTGKPLLTGNPRGPDRNELGWKEVFRMNPGEVITLVAKFDQPAVPFKTPSSPRMDTIASSPAPGDLALFPQGTTFNEYVYHCHILEHEEHDMMRPLVTAGLPLEVTQVQEVAIPTKGYTTATFFVSGAKGPYKVTNDKVQLAPSSGKRPKAGGALMPTLQSYGFNVKVTGDTLPGTYWYTVTDSAKAKVVGVLKVLEANQAVPVIPPEGVDETLNPDLV